MNNLSKRLESTLKPLYEKLLELKKTVDCAFCMQWGKNFSNVINTGILFVGKSVNGWITDEKDIDILFGNGSKRIFDRDDQMQWVDNLEGNIEGYNTSKSAFWRVVKTISQEFYPNNWFSHIAWSNLYKLSPFESGNPSNTLREKQLQLCREVLKNEIEILSPKYIVLLTSGWEKDFLCYLNGNNPTESIYKETWDDIHQIKVYEINNRIFISSSHPQGKNEIKHIETIIKLLKSY